MAINFHPRQGAVLLCNFTGIVPEMIKRRPVVVISPKLRNRTNLCTVIPLSTTPPSVIEPYHFQVNNPGLPDPWTRETMWAKCDMLATVCFERLDRFKVARRQYESFYVTAEEIIELQKGMLCATGMRHLTGYL